MTYHIRYSRLKTFTTQLLALRAQIRAGIDDIVCTVGTSMSHSVSTDEVYLELLQLEGQYRATEGQWASPSVQYRVIPA